MGIMNYTNIEIRYGNEYRMLINNKIYDKSMFFYPVFKKSAEIIREICSYDRDYCREQFALYYPNNIIMYCAERGGGKSSAMISFAAALKHLDCPDKKNEDDFNEFWGDIPATYSFSVLDVIDPTTIFEKEIFMRIVLSKMFSELRNLWEQQDKESCANNCNNFDRNKILEKFRKCYGLVDMIYQHCGEFNGNDDLEELADLGDSTNLKKEFKDLVDCFLCQFDGKHKKSFLVIQIDDADLNAKMAYQIIEDIRKYCIIPNVIVLMAVNMEQMHQIIEQHFVCDFENLLKVSHNADDPITLDDTKDMAVRYINKLMPSTHQIHLPKIADFLRNSSSTLKLAYVKKIDGKEKDLLSYTDGEAEDSTIDYQERLIRLVYKKTGVMLVKTKNFIHNFLPQNMRELSHFLSYFCAMPDLDSRIGFAELFSILSQNAQIDNITLEQAEKEFEKRKNNLEALEQYLVKFWADINLLRKNNKITSALANTVETIRINSAIKICDKWKGLTASLSDNDDVPPISYNSYANLMDKLTQIAKNAMSSDDFAETYRMVYALQLLFTIFLHKEALLCIRRKSFERLYKIVNGELWTYYTSNEDKLIGRFKVDYRILTKLNPKKGYDVAGTNTLSDCCYLRSQNSNFRIDFHNPKIVNALKKIESGNSDDIIIYDVGVSLFNILTNTQYYSGGSKELARLNKIYDFLMNWDVRHYVEKILDNKLSSASENSNNLPELQKNYCDWIDNAFGATDLSYCNSAKRNDIIKLSEKDVLPICLSNRELAKKITGQAIQEMNGMAILRDFNEKVHTDNAAEILQFKERLQMQLSSYFEKIKPLESISSTVKTLSEKIALIEHAFDIADFKIDNTEVIAGDEIKFKAAELAKELIENNTNKLVLAIKVFKEFIDKPELEGNILSEIDNAFDGKESEESKPVEALSEKKEEAPKTQKSRTGQAGNKALTTKTNTTKETTQNTPEKTKTQPKSKALTTKSNTQKETVPKGSNKTDSKAQTTKKTETNASNKSAAKTTKKTKNKNMGR